MRKGFFQIVVCPKIRDVAQVWTTKLEALIVEVSLWRGNCKKLKSLTFLGLKIAPFQKEILLLNLQNLPLQY